MNESVLIQEINNLKLMLANITNDVNELKFKLQNNIGICGPPGPQGNQGNQGAAGAQAASAVRHRRASLGVDCGQRYPLRDFERVWCLVAAASAVLAEHDAGAVPAACPAAPLLRHRICDGHSDMRSGCRQRLLHDRRDDRDRRPDAGRTRPPPPGARPGLDPGPLPASVPGAARGAGFPRLGEDAS